MRLEERTGQTLKLCLIGIGISAVAFFLFQYIKFFDSINDLLLDQFIVHSNNRQPDERVLVIEINDESVSQLGRPVPRSHYVKLIRKLSTFGAKTITFDLLFIDESDSSSDSQLAFVADSVQHVIHCFTFSDDEPNLSLVQDRCYEKYSIKFTDETDVSVISALDATFPHKTFINSFNQAGFATAEWDYDGRIRRLPLFIEFNNQMYPCLGIMALLDYFGVSEKSVKIEESFWGRKVIIETSNEIIRIPINSKGQLLLNFYGIFDVLKPVPLHEIMNLLDAFQPKATAQVSLPLFEGKIVLIGNTETGVDKLVSPFSADFPGVGVHATLISNILQGDFITEASWKINSIISAILSLLLLGAFIYYQKFSKSIWIFYIFPIALFIVFNIIAYFLFFKYISIWLKLIQIDSAYLVLFVSILFYEKVIRLKELNSKINQLEDDILIKNSDLEKLNQNIDSQTEQYKTIQYFVTQLQTVLKEPSINQQEDLKKFFPGFFEQYEIMRIKLEGKIRQLNLEKEKIVKEKQKLEQEKNIYQNILNGNVPTRQRTYQERPKIDKMKVAKEIMSAWQYFQSQQRKENLSADSTFGIIALTEIMNEKGKKVTTPMGEIIKKIQKISSFDCTVLITGEPGTGKELVAEAIHNQSGRANKRLVKVNSAALPENLLESELFGHVKGAFSGAHRDRKGKFEYADGGTIFLDEIGDLKFDLQAKLLRVLEYKEFQKVGSDETTQVDVRVIAATNKNLNKSIEDNEFRSDLYARLKVIVLHIPALRQRKYDIPFLIRHFLNEFNKKESKEKSFSNEAIIAAICYDWPDNIRDLQNLVEEVCIFTSENEIPLSVFPEEIQSTYRDIFESKEVPWWSQIKKLVQQEQKRLLDACKTAIKANRIDEFLRSKHLQADNKTCANCYEYFQVFVNGIASIFPADNRKELVRESIVQMQQQLFQWCRNGNIKLGDRYDEIEKILGRTRRRIDDWRKE